MSTKLCIFISYSHENTAEKQTLLSKLEKNNNFEVRCDVGDQRLAEDLYREISNNLNWSDAIVPIITPHWLKSNQCRDELVRAHERRRRIIPFRHADVPEGPPDIPHYLTQHLHVKWDNRNIESNIDELIRRLESIRIERWKGDCQRAIRSMGDYIQEAEKTPIWKAGLSKRIVNTVQKHLRKILKDSECTFEISPDHTYLNLADPLFGNAESIIAICIAQISSFWTNPYFFNKATDYLGNQKNSAKSITRLFVFKSAEEANSYKNILQSHQLKYGSRPNNGVFFCSLDSYKELLNRWDYDTPSETLTQDFGILTFDGDALPVHAFLNDREFRLREFKLEDNTETRNQLVIEQFKAFHLLQAGEYSKQTGVTRWAEHFYDDPQKFANALIQTFGDRCGRISHYVGLKPRMDDNTFGEYLYELAMRFYSDRKRLHIIDLRVERRVSSLKPVDGRFEGELVMRAAFDFLLRIDFETKEALTHYYGHQIHSLEREKLYIRLNPGIERNFDAVKLIPLNDSNGRRRAFEAIEEIMQAGGFIGRYDAIDEEPIGNIIKRPGVPFGDLTR